MFKQTLTKTKHKKIDINSLKSAIKSNNKLMAILQYVYLVINNAPELSEPSDELDFLVDIFGGNFWALIQHQDTTREFTSVRVRHARSQPENIKLQPVSETAYFKNHMSLFDVKYYSKENQYLALLLTLLLDDVQLFDDFLNPVDYQNEELIYSVNTNHLKDLSKEIIEAHGYYQLYNDIVLAAEYQIPVAGACKKILTLIEPYNKDIRDKLTTLAEKNRIAHRKIQEQKNQQKARELSAKEVEQAINQFEQVSSFETEFTALSDYKPHISQIWQRLSEIKNLGQVLDKESQSEIFEKVEKTLKRYSRKNFLIYLVLLRANKILTLYQEQELKNTYEYQIKFDCINELQKLIRHDRGYNHKLPEIRQQILTTLAKLFVPNRDVQKKMLAGKVYPKYRFFRLLLILLAELNYIEKVIPTPKKSNGNFQPSIAVTKPKEATPSIQQLENTLKDKINYNNKHHEISLAEFINTVEEYSSLVSHRYTTNYGNKFRHANYMLDYLFQHYMPMLKKGFTEKALSTNYTLKQDWQLLSLAKTRYLFIEKLFTAILPNAEKLRQLVDYFDNEIHIERLNTQTNITDSFDKVLLQCQQDLQFIRQQHPQLIGSKQLTTSKLFQTNKSSSKNKRVQTKPANNDETVQDLKMS